MTEATPVVEPVTPDVPVPATEPQGDPAAAPAAPAEPVSETPADDGTPPGEKPRSRAQDRIEELARANKNLREHNEWLREQALAARRQAPAEPTAPAAPAPAPVEEDEPAPTLESVGFDQDKFTKELAAWTKKQIDSGVKRGVETALNTRAVKAAERSQEQVVVEAAKKFRESHEDFDIVVGNPNLKWTPTVLATLREAGETSPSLGYYLGNNPDKLAEIAALTPTQQVRALGRIEAELGRQAPAAAPTPPAVPPKPSAPAAAPAAPAKKPATNAPPPPTPVSGSAPADIDPLSLSTVEWRKWRNQQLRDKAAANAKPAGRTVRSF